VVTSRNGTEAGVWVIAETRELVVHFQLRPSPLAK
jgi:hypothetical protein